MITGHDSTDAREEGAPPMSASDPTDTHRIASVLRGLSFKRASAVYVFIAIFILFALWIPNTFLTSTNWKTLIANGAITGIVSVGLVIPLAAGVFDLAIGAEVGFGAILVAWLLGDKGFAIVPAILITLVAGGLVGLTSGLLIVKARIDSFIATLGVSSVLLALISWVSGGQQILGLSAGFQTLGTTQILGLTLPVYIMVAVALLVWYFLERAPIGRSVYATGGNPVAARLAGVSTAKVTIGSLIVCGVIAAGGGILLSSQLATGDPTVGPSYLLPAFSATFLGSTQFRDGRFNSWGTIVAVYLLATGVTGLQLAGAPVWIPNLFDGLALLIAVGIAKHQSSGLRTSAIVRLISRRRSEHEG